MIVLNLETVLESIEVKSNNKNDSYTGKQIVLSGKKVPIFLAVSGDMHIHLLIEDKTSLDHNALKALQMKNVSCQISDVLVNSQIKNVIKISSTAKLNDVSRKPFLSFCEDVIKHLETSNKEPFETIKIVFRRWKKFWSTNDGSLPSQEWIRGLIGELSLLELLISKFGGSVVAIWEGPKGGIADFYANKIGIEVKTSQMKPVIIKVHGLNQFDNERYAQLLLCLYRIEEKSEGRSIVDIIRIIENQLEISDKFLDEFWDKLACVGYRRDLEYYYSKFTFEINQPLFYAVDDHFPKLTKNSFSDKVDLRIFEINYSIELSNIKPLPDLEYIKSFKKLAKDI